MATKRKAATKTKAKKAPTVKAVKAPKAPKVAKEPKVNTARELIEDPKFSTNAHDGEKSGAFIKRMLETNALTTQEIVEATQENFPGSKVKGSDVGFHRAKLKADGTVTQVVRIDKEGQRYTLSA